MMKALSIRQPWAWLIFNKGKDIENRTWKTNFRGRVLVHAAKGITHAEHEEVARKLAFFTPKSRIPEINDLERGGIIGSIEIVDCVEKSDSSWFTGPYGFVLANPEPMPFIPLRGMLGFFEVDESLLKSHG